MKAYISSSGDPSVGINGFSTEIDLDIDLDDSDDQREGIRKALSDCFIIVWGVGKVRVLFEDELAEPEDDGQPDEAQEWHDFDPDC